MIKLIHIITIFGHINKVVVKLKKSNYHCSECHEAFVMEAHRRRVIIDKHTSIRCVFCKSVLNCKSITFELSEQNIICLRCFQKCPYLITKGAWMYNDIINENTPLLHLIKYSNNFL